MGRWFRPAGFVLVAFFLLLPFVAVSCDVPGGFGRAAPGGTTTYTGVQLMLGESPDIQPVDKIRGGTDQKLDPQPLLLMVFLLAVAGMVIAVVVQNQLVRRAVLTGVAGLAAIFVVTSQITVEALLRERIRAQVTQPLPPNKQINDFVHTQLGFVLCLGTLVLMVIIHGVGWFRSANRPPALVAPEATTQTIA
jgi:hypothetical protein